MERRGWTVIVWLILALVLGRFAMNVEEVLQVGATVPDSESEAARLVVDSVLPAGDAEYAVLVVRGLDPREAPEARARIDSLVASITAVSGVSRVRAYREPRDSLLVGNGGTLVLAALDPAVGPSDHLIPLLREATASLAERWSATAVLSWTGESALNYDLRRTSARDATRAEWRALPVTALILVLAFASVVAAGVPVVVGILTITCALGVAGLVGQVLALSLILQTLVSMIGLGLGIDYGLLMVSRFRESLRSGNSAVTAGAIAARHGGRTIRMSGIAVMLGFGGLILVPVGELRSVGFGGLVVVAFAVGVSTTLLPRLLVLLRPVLDRFRLGTWATKPTSTVWRRWGMWVSEHPVVVLAAAGLPLLWLAWQATQLRVATPREDWLPPSMESARGIADLRAMGRSALLQRTRVVIRLPEEEDALTPRGWSTIRAVRAELLGDERIASVLSFSQFARQGPISQLVFFGIPRTLRDAYVSADRRTLLLDAVPREGVEPEEMVAFVRHVRATVREQAVGRADILVGGLPAFQADYSDRVSGHLPKVVLLVVSGTFLALAIGFRSLLIPLKALVLNLLAVAAGFGVVKLVFQDGWALATLGLDAPISGVFPVIPTLVFCTVFGLSMDYEVFLVTRVAEFKRAGAAERDAIVRGLEHSAPVISSAAAIMVVVFGAFALGEYLVIKILGVALAASVLLDATLVRVAVGPALLTLAGRWNWWPGVRTVPHA
jgi:RND superfamily putative drug exporter